MCSQRDFQSNNGQMTVCPLNTVVHMYNGVIKDGLLTKKDKTDDLRKVTELRNEFMEQLKS